MHNRIVAPHVSMGFNPPDSRASRVQVFNMETELDFLGGLRRTHTCGQLRAGDAGQRALLMGWVHRHRDLGGV
ncbi:MAG TPA: hypothetical protein VMT86_06125, partial [Bryobacteraceae bacterium]|nr:hypothetical protein [Bryobacteraceae bacterium]